MGKCTRLLTLCLIVATISHVFCLFDLPERGNNDEGAGDEEEETEVFNYNLYLQRPHSTRVDSKSKVETLGSTLKGHILDLKSTANKKIDIVFLVDASTSVGKNNFKEEIKFVKKLLSDFTVDVDHTRVSVVTYSSRGRVINHVDYLRESNEDRHKCALLEEDLGNIVYTGGGTFTLGAFLEAKKVLQNARPDSSKAVFLVTDGFSNGGDPMPEAQALKRDGVKIFTFGIQNGNVRELFGMASEPKNESCYILDSFEEFEALARRALHEDLSAGVYLTQPLSKCDKLCVGKNCCDEQAVCICGTHTGKYECMCPPGYYGNGLKGSCRACPSGSYKPEMIIGDVLTCTKCPDENHVTEPGATQEDQCQCKKGFRSFNGTGCAALKCPSLQVPKNGYFVNDRCKSVFNAACGLRCKPGYELRGSSLRICREDGTWSGTETSCIMKTCPALMIPKNGNMICSTDDFTFNTVCRFTCDTGYKLVGSRKRTCLAIAFWTGINTRCREITCQPLAVVRDGSIHPPSCTAGEVAFGTTCSVTCHLGYSLIGPHNKQCLPEGLWTQSMEVNQCVDTSAPLILCPYNMEAETDLNEDTATVSWQVPLAVDNSGYVPILSSSPVVAPPSRFPIGTTKVTYVAEDLNKNKAECHFYINVKDKQMPTIDRCFSPLPIVSPEPYADVTWEEPLFSDNSNQEVRVHRSHAPGLFKSGRTDVTYTAYDKSGNNNTCVVKINVIPHPCEYPPTPLNGNRTCYEDIDGVVCSFSCKPGYSFTIPPATEYRCAFDNVWEPKDQIPVSDCSALQLSNEIIQPASFTFAGLFACTQKLELKKLENDFEKRVKKRVTELCEEGVSCSISDLQTTCRQADEADSSQIVLERYRRDLVARNRRDTDELTGTFRLNDGSIITFTYLIKSSGSKGPNDQTTTTDKPDQTKLMSAVENIMKTLTKDAKRGDFNLEVNGQTLELTNMTFADDPTFVCDVGSVAVDNSCAKCPVGTFFNIVTERCESCKVGTFQPIMGQISCLYCPHNTSTPNAHATTEEDCRALCLPGTFSSNGLEMCETCKKGHYQQEYGQLGCEKCPKGQTTLRRGAMTEDKCKTRCEPGYVSKTGVEPCWPCPRGYYQPERGQSACVQCPDKSNTAIKAAAHITDCDGVLASMEQSDAPHNDGISADGQQQLLLADDCFSSPCENGGTCEANLLFGFSCICAPGYTGLACEQDINECAVDPCLNGATCLNMLAQYVCQCETGFTGQKCEVNIDDCEGDVCQNGGTCVDEVDTYTCKCANGFTGGKCEVNINDCKVDSCLNGGTCEDEAAGYSCQCPDGITGKNCEINEDNCASGPCLNDATCVDGRGTYTCTCQAGYTGPQCEVDIDECASNPCSQDATCDDLQDAYRCHCPRGFNGHDCTQEIDINFQLDFPATATTTDYAALTIDNDLRAASACFWMKTTDDQNQGTPFSYATSEGDNIFTLSDYDGFVLFVNGEKRTTTTKANDGDWHHICIVWASNRGAWKIFLDGITVDSGRNLANGQVIKGGGNFVIGQEQDHIENGGGFSPPETFIGKLTQLNVWSRELSLQDIEDLRLKCEKQIGDVIAWPDMLAQIKGSISSSPVEFCKDCPALDPIDYGNVTYTSQTAGSKAKYSCRNGFEIGGKPERQCLVTGEWEGRTPTCQRKNCGWPGSLSNGWIDGNVYEFDNRIRYVCNVGYKLEGKETRYCGEFGFWEGDPPTCEKIQCTIPDLTDNTLVKNPSPNNKYDIGTDVFFECTPGNKLYTDYDSVLCERYGHWDRSLPSCDPQKCSLPPTISHGRPNNTVDLSEFSVGFNVQYVCDFGYWLSKTSSNPQGHLACLPTGQWEDNLPSCVLVECYDPPIISNGKVDFTTTTFLSRAEYSCNKGYELTTDSLLECFERGAWEPEAPECAAVQCGRPDDIVHGRFEGEVFSYKGVVKYVCDLGYKVIGNAVRECLDNATWSNETPVCKPVSCGKPEEIVNGVTIGRDYTLNKEITYRCNNGFELDGFAERVCRETGKWSNAVPSCRRTECGAPPVIQSGFYTETSFYFEDTVTYNCEDGFYLDGDDTLTCLATKQWSGNSPVCLAIQCPGPPRIDNGIIINPDSLELFPIGHRIQYSCNVGFELARDATNPLGQLECLRSGQWDALPPICSKSECGQPTSISNGIFTTTGLDYLSTATYSCLQGFKLRGDPVYTCSASGLWEGSSVTLPTCQVTECALPPFVENGRLDYKSLEIGSTIRYICNEGYRLAGLEVRRCIADLTWEADNPTCQAVDCGDPGNVANGTRELTDTLFQAVVRYSCDVGFIMKGDTLRTCTKEGNWSGSLPTCDIVYCETPSAVISNGRLIGQSFTYGSVVNYVCDEGYHMDGFPVRRCLANGQWDTPVPGCTAVECPRLSVKFGTLSGFKTSYGTTVTVTCRQGYRQSGASERTCQQDGSWSGEETICTKYECKDLSPPAYGQVYIRNGVATYHCLEGYDLKGPTQRLCQANDEWNLEAPTCEPIMCPDIIGTGFPNGVPTFTSLAFGSSIIFECNTGFVLRGDRKLDCLLGGVWSGSLPVCEKRTCFPPFSTSNSRIVGGDYSFNSVISYVCDDGYILSGEAERVCQADGSWSGRSPRCDLIVCPRPEPNVNVIISGSIFTFGAEVDYLCNSGYNLIGPAKRTCTALGVWSGDEPYCVRSECPQPPKIDNGRIIATSYDKGARIVYECNEGYKLSGMDFRICMGTLAWSGVAPTCHKVQCPEPPPLANGFHVGDNWFYQDFIEYQCEAGYELRGENRRLCLSVGRWGGADPSCIKVTCGTPPVPRNVLFTLPESSDGGSYQEKATLGCEEGYQGVGVNYQTCMANGRWSDTNFRCEIVQCEDIVSIPNGYILGYGTRFGTELTFECEDGYNLVGKSKIRCLASGHWDFEFQPYCERASCPQPTPLSNGRFAMSGNGEIGSVMTLSCDEGYRLHGSDRRECNADQTWGGSDPHCILIICEIPPFVDNAEPFDTRALYYYQSTARYVCNTGYKITAGDSILTCSNSGSWEGTVPSCALIECGEPTDVKHGSVIVGAYTYGSSASYLCEEGYRVKGKQSIQCDASGNWSGSIPTCVPINCGEPPNVDNAVYISNQQNQHKSVVTFICNDGFRLKGIQTAECLATGQWSGSPPVCEPTSCGPPPLIDFAEYIGDDFFYRSIVTYSCIDGYEMTGKPSLQCGQAGAWEGDYPKCHQIECGPYPTFANAFTKLSNGVKTGSIASFVCEEGFFLLGSTSAMCNNNKTWVYDGQQPTCEKYNCGEPPAIRYGRAVSSGSGTSPGVSYVCDEGYNLIGSGFMLCGTNGEWQGVLPYCKIVECGPPPLGQYMVSLGKDYSYGSSVTYECNSGYRMSGQSRLTCQSSGLWSGSHPTCSRIACQPLKLPDHGLVLDGSLDGAVYTGDSVALGCEEDFILVGSDTLRCDDSGIWSDDAPRCESKNSYQTCEGPTGVDYAQVPPEPLPVGSTLVVTCQTGYEASGDMMTVCQEDRTWAAIPGTCKRVFCGKPRIRDHVNVVQVEGTSFYFGDVFHYRCRAGVSPARRQSSIMCLANGQWDGVVACGVTCKRQCQNGGLCLGLNRCKCPTGYGGEVCEKALCILPCLNGGVCSAPYQCTCPPGYSGIRCNEVICNKPCANGGQCLRPNKCKCPHGYAGAFCDKTLN